jgi:hypothetical protein
MGSFARCFCPRGNVPSEESPTRSLLERRAEASDLHLYQLREHVLTEEVIHSHPRATNDNDKVLAVSC